MGFGFVWVLGQILGLILGLISFVVLCGSSFINENVKFIYFVNLIILANNKFSNFGI